MDDTDGSSAYPLGTDGLGHCVLSRAIEAVLRSERPKLSRGSDLAKAMDYMLKPGRHSRADGGRLCLSNNAAERALRSGAPQRTLA